MQPSAQGMCNNDCARTNRGTNANELQDLGQVQVVRGGSATARLPDGTGAEVPRFLLPEMCIKVQFRVEQLCIC